MKQEKEGTFFKVICEEVDAFGKQIHIDVNRGNMEEVFDVIQANYEKYPLAKWELYTMLYRAN